VKIRKFQEKFEKVQENLGVNMSIFDEILGKFEKVQKNPKKVKN
jgi:hypothetical protein